MTFRAAVLAVALASVVLALALPFKVWLAQRGDIVALEQQTRAQQARVAALQAQQDLWKDPAYVRAQARERLHMVLPGETAYVVLGAPAAGRPQAQPGLQHSVPTNAPWYSMLWRTVEVAGRPAPGQARPAAPRPAAPSRPTPTPATAQR